MGQVKNLPGVQQVTTIGFAKKMHRLPIGLAIECWLYFLDTLFGPVLHVFKRIHMKEKKSARTKDPCNLFEDRAQKQIRKRMEGHITHDRVKLTRRKGKSLSHICLKKNHRQASLSSFLLRPHHSFV